MTDDREAVPKFKEIYRLLEEESYHEIYRIFCHYIDNDELEYLNPTKLMEDIGLYLVYNNLNRSFDFEKLNLV